MTSPLFFIPRLFRALRQEYARSALESELKRIRQLGEAKEYEKGNDQFMRFMEVVADASEPVQLREVVIERDGNTIARHSFPNRNGTILVQDAHPGLYRISLSTGRVLWEGSIERDDLLTGITPLRSLKLAADTGQEREPNREIVLLPGELTLRCFAGAVSGQIEIVFSGSAG